MRIRDDKITEELHPLSRKGSDFERLKEITRRIEMVEIERMGLMKIPFSTTFRTSKSSADSLENVIVVLSTEEGVAGVGESAPTQFTGESKKTVIGSIEGIEGIIKDCRFTNYREIHNEIREKFRTQHSARAAVEIGLFDALSKFWEIPLTDLFGGSEEKVVTDATVPISGVEESLEIAGKHAERGFETVKIKVGRDWEEDLERISKISERFPNLKIRVDANQAFEPKEALRFLEKIEDLGIHPEIFEQPVGRENIPGLRFLKERTDVKIAADESLFSARDAITLIKREAVDVFNLKIMESGLVEALEIISIGSNSDVELMIGCMGESDIGIKTASSLAAGTGKFDYVDLDSQLFLGEGAAELPPNPLIGPERGYGHGASIEKLEDYISWIE